MLSSANPAQAQFYCEVLDEHRDTLPHYLARTATLDFFGRIVVGHENIKNFFKDEHPFTKHILEEVKQSMATKHYINLQDFQNLENDTSVNMVTDAEDGAHCVTPDRKICRPWDEEDNTGIENLGDMSLENVDLNYHQTSLYHAPKKPKIKHWHFDKTDQNECGTFMPLPREPAYYLEATGSLQYTTHDKSPSSTKTLKTIALLRNPKCRNFKLNLGFTQIDNQIQISTIIYYDKMSCRKKLVFPEVGD